MEALSDVPLHTRTAYHSAHYLFTSETYTECDENDIADLLNMVHPHMVSFPSLTSLLVS